MFVVSVKTTRKKIFIIAIIVLLAVVLLGLMISGFGTEAGTITVDGVKYSLKAGNNEERRAFLKQFGWECSDEPIELVDVRIPSEFNDVYTQYNDLQTSQGFDLEKVKGVRVKRCTYEILNYPDQPEGIRANLLICDGKVVGGDISSVAIDGFMHGFAEGNPAQTFGDSAPLPSDSAQTQGDAQKEAEDTAADSPTSEDAAAQGGNGGPSESDSAGAEEDEDEELLAAQNLLEMG